MEHIGIRNLTSVIFWPYLKYVFGFASIDSPAMFLDFRKFFSTESLSQQIQQN